MRHPKQLILLCVYVVLPGCTLTFAQATQANSKPTRIEELRKRAEAGDPKAQNELGVAYRMGEGVPKDKTEALNWYKKSARQGFADGMFNLGGSYYNGDGVNSDAQLAWAWFMLAKIAGSAEAGEAVGRISGELSKLRNAIAEKQLAGLYQTGTEIPQSDTEAFKWYQKSAQDDDADAQFTICKLLAEGKGTQKDESSALKWCERSAHNLNILAMLELGRMYENGIGSKQSHGKAEQYYRYAIESLSPEAMYQLGLLYKKSDSKKKEPIAYSLFLLADAYGYHEALVEAKSLRDVLSKEQEAKAREEALQFSRSRGRTGLSLKSSRP
jgi:TPR repeat protein